MLVEISLISLKTRKLGVFQFNFQIVEHCAIVNNCMKYLFVPLTSNLIGPDKVLHIKAPKWQLNYVSFSRKAAYLREELWIHIYKTRTYKSRRALKG